MRVVDFDEEDELELESKFRRKLSKTNKEDRLKRQAVPDTYQRDKKPHINRETIRTITED